MLARAEFELLFDLGITAILDSYYREAVSAFAAAIERFYEFFLTAISIKRGVSQEEFDKTWKIIANQAERQLGAFVLLYLNERGRTPQTLKDKSVSFRNAVIHKGRLPTRGEAIDFGTEVLMLILSDLEYLKQSEAAHVGTAVGRHVARLALSPPIARTLLSCKCQLRLVLQGRLPSRSPPLPMQWLVWGRIVPAGYQRMALNPAERTAKLLLISIPVGRSRDMHCGGFLVTRSWLVGSVFRSESPLRGCRSPLEVGRIADEQTHLHGKTETEGEHAA